MKIEHTFTRAYYIEEKLFPCCVPSGLNADANVNALEFERHNVRAKHALGVTPPTALLTLQSVVNVVRYNFKMKMSNRDSEGTKAKVGFYNYPEPKRAVVTYSSPPSASNPALRGLPLVYAAALVARFLKSRPTCTEMLVSERCPNSKNWISLSHAVIPG